MYDNDKAQILAVDDTEDNLDPLCEVFAELPYELVTARTPRKL